MAELQEQLLSHGNEPFVLIGSSWGAVLALLFASKHVALVKKLILVGSAVFDAESSKRVQAARVNRMSPETRAQFQELTEKLKEAQETEKNQLYKKLADTFFDSDVFDPTTSPSRHGT